MCHLIKNHKNAHLCYLLISISKFDFALKASTLMSITLWMLSRVHRHANSANFSVFSIKRETVFFQQLELAASLGRCPHHWIAAYFSMPLLLSETVSQGTNSHIILIPAGVCHWSPRSHACPLIQKQGYLITSKMLFLVSLTSMKTFNPFSLVCYKFLQLDKHLWYQYVLS